MVIIKIILIFILLVLLLRLKIPFSIAVLVGGLVLGIGFNLGFADIGRTALATIQDPETISLSLIVGIILVLSELLQASGQMTELGQVIIRTFGLHRWTYTILPAIIGLLPMPGGALFSAPMMDGVSDELIPAHKKTLINYCFRHIWEYSLPLYPGLVLAAGIAHVNLNTISLFQSPFTVLSALLGVIFILPGIRILDEHSSNREHLLERNEHAHKSSFKDFLRMTYLISPIIIIFLFMAFKLDMLICILAGLGVAILHILLSRKLKITEVLKTIFAKLSVYRMVLVVINVLIFTGIMRSSTLIQELSIVFSGGANGNAVTQIPFVYMTIAIIFLPLIVGLLTGLTVGFVGITFPLIFSTIVPTGMDVLPMAALAYVSGATGVMLSPVHLCLVLTNQYYNSDFSKVYKTLIPMSMVVLVLAVAGFLFYTLL